MSFCPLLGRQRQWNSRIDSFLAQEDQRTNPGLVQRHKGSQIFYLVYTVLHMVHVVYTITCISSL